MGKWANNNFYKAAFDYVRECDVMYVCSQAPADYTEASDTYALASVAMAAGDYEDDAGGAPDGRKLGVKAKTVLGLDDGDGTHLALVKAGDTSLRYVTTQTKVGIEDTVSQDIKAFEILIRAPQ